MDKSDCATSRVAAPKPYQKPILVKGPVLTNVTSTITNVSGIGGGDSSSSACWVARAAFGEADIRWLIFRAWLMDDAPIWFRRLYIRHGEAVGGWLAARVGLRRVVRTLMIPAVNHKLRG